MHFSLYRGLASLLLAPDGQEIPITTLQNVLHMQRTSPSSNGSYGNVSLSMNEEFTVIQRLQQHLQHVNAGFDSIYGQGGTDGFGSFNISHEKWELGVFRENLRRGVEQIVKTVLRGSSGYMNLAQPSSPTHTPTSGSRKPSLYTSKQSESISRMALALENAYFFIVGESYRNNNVGVSSPTQSGYPPALYSSVRQPIHAPSNMQEDIGSKSVPAISMSSYRSNDSSSMGMNTTTADLSTSSEPKYPGTVHEDAIQKTQLLTEALKPAKSLIRRDSSTSLKWTRSLSRRKSKKTLKRAISNPHLVSTTQNLDNAIDLVHLPQTNVPYNQGDQSHVSVGDTSQTTPISTQHDTPEASPMRSTPGYSAGAADFRTSAQSRESQGSRHTGGSNHMTLSSQSQTQPVSGLADGHSSSHSTEFAPFGKEPGPVMYVQSHAPAFSQRLNHALPTLPHEKSTPHAMPPLNNSIYPAPRPECTENIIADDSTSSLTGFSAQPVAPDVSTGLRVGPVPTPVSTPPSSVNAKIHAIARKSPMVPMESIGNHFLAMNPTSSPSQSPPGAASRKPDSSLASPQRPPQDLGRMSCTSTVVNGEVITFPSMDEPSIDTNHRISVAPEQRDSLVSAKVSTNTISSTPRKSRGDSVYDIYFAKTKDEDTSVNHTATTDKFKEEVSMGSRAAVTSQYFADPLRARMSRATRPIGNTNNPIWQVVAGLNDRSSMYSEVDPPDKRVSDASVASRRDTVAPYPASSEQDSRALFMEARSAAPDFAPIPPLSLANASLHRLGSFDVDDDTHTLSSTEDVPDDGRVTPTAPTATGTVDADAGSNLGTTSANTGVPLRSSSPIIELNDQGLPVQIVYYNDDELPAIMDKIASGNNSARIEFRRRSAYPDMQQSEQAEADDPANRTEDASHLAKVEQSILSLLRPTFSSFKLGS